MPVGELRRICVRSIHPMAKKSQNGVAGVGGVVHGRLYTYAMADDSVLDEIQDNVKEAGQRLRASLSLLHSQGVIDDAYYHELALCLRTSLAMVEACYMEARRRE